jgi:hypothetical protein
MTKLSLGSQQLARDLATLVQDSQNDYGVVGIAIEDGVRPHGTETNVATQL